MDKMEERRKALRKVVAEHGGFAATVSRFGLTSSQASYLSQLTSVDSSSSFGERSAKNWEERLRLTPGALVNAGYAVEAQPIVIEGSPTNAVVVPLLANAGSMGLGTEVMAEDVFVGSLMLSPDWLDKHVRPINTQGLRFIHGYGDSMIPTFADGDVLLVDTFVREPSIDGVYVLQAHQRLFIKRVRQRLDGSYEVSSDNPNVKTIDVLDGTHQVDVLGRVVWAWNGKKL